jgi:hypothetical protein
VAFGVGAELMSRPTVISPDVVEVVVDIGGFVVVVRVLRTATTYFFGVDGKDLSLGRMVSKSLKISGKLHYVLLELGKEIAIYDVLYGYRMISS